MIRVKANWQVNKNDWKAVEALETVNSGNGWEDKQAENGNVYRVYYPTWTTPKSVNLVFAPNNGTRENIGV